MHTSTVVQDVQWSSNTLPGAAVSEYEGFNHSNEPENVQVANASQQSVHRVPSWPKNAMKMVPRRHKRPSVSPIKRKLFCNSNGTDQYVGDVGECSHTAGSPNFKRPRSVAKPHRNVHTWSSQP